MLTSFYPGNRSRYLRYQLRQAAVIIGLSGVAGFLLGMELCSCADAATSSDGSSVWVDLGARDDNHGVWLETEMDGWHDAGVRSGVDCRHNDLSPHGRWKGEFLYFRVSNEWAYQGSRPEVWIRIEYFDESVNAAVRVEYDAIGDGLPARYNSAGVIEMKGTGRWLFHTFHLSDAYFGDRENGGSDFRISCGKNTVCLNRVWVYASAPPVSPSVISPANGVDVGGLRELIWSEDDAADSVKFRLTSKSVLDARALWSSTFGPGAKLRPHLPRLRDGTEYWVWGQTAIAKQWTPWTSQRVRVVNRAPSSPTKLAFTPVTASTDGSALLTWEGAPHDAFEIAYAQDAPARTTSVILTHSMFDDAGIGPLCLGIRYRVRVRLHNLRGWGHWSNPLTISIPSAPSAVAYPRLRGYSPHPYGSISDLRYDYHAILDRLAGRGISLVRSMPFNAWDVQPFRKTADGRYDLNAIDLDYLNRIRDFVVYANTKGFIVQLSVFEHCSLRHGEVRDRFALTKGNNTQDVAITAVNFASFWREPDGPEMSFYRRWAEALTEVTRGCRVILEVMNEPYVTNPDTLEFHRSIIKILRDAGAEKVSLCAWDDVAARELASSVDYVSWHDNRFAERNSVPPDKVILSTDTGGWHSKSKVLVWAKDAVKHGYHFEHMALGDDGDTGEIDTDWRFVEALGATKQIGDTPR